MYVIARNLSDENLTNNSIKEKVKKNQNPNYFAKRTEAKFVSYFFLKNRVIHFLVQFVQKRQKMIAEI
jgi:hypothetical protein